MMFSYLDNIDTVINSLKIRRRILSKNVSCRTKIFNIVPLQKLSIFSLKN